ncbi:MAG TPA: hypothetical protein VFF74_11695 [Methylophilaceae bacterium]|nr:hypothetical protein [Methylophilaceae bacterium]
METELERDFLISIGCDEMQGFLYSKPLTMLELTRLVNPKKLLRQRDDA